MGIGGFNKILLVFLVAVTFLHQECVLYQVGTPIFFFSHFFTFGDISSHFKQKNFEKCTGPISIIPGLYEGLYRVSTTH